MRNSAATGWGNHDITSDGRVVEECVTTDDGPREVVWYDERGRVARSTGGRRATRGMTA